MSRRLLQCRIIFYTVVILMHFTNSLYLVRLAVQRNHKYEALNFEDLDYLLFVTWHITIQIFYCILGMACDALLLKNLRTPNYQIPGPWSFIRDIIYAGVVVPSSLTVFTIFWGLYAYDKSLIYPKLLDEKFVPSISNHVIHTAIMPVAMFDIVFRPRTEPRSHVKFITQLCLNLAVFVGRILYTFQVRKIWLYPILEQLYETVYFFLAFACIGSLFFIFYYAQWPLTRMIHRPPQTR